MSTLTLSQLPDVCLLAIFDRLPLRDLAIIGDVSEHWATLQHTIFTRRGILTLLIGSQPYNLVNSSYFSYPLNNSMTVALHGTSKSSAELPKLDESTVKTLIEQYPHRARLEIAINNLDSSSVTTHLISLLEASSSTLISLKLWLRFALPDRLSLTAKNLISSDLFRLLSVINSLPHLTCLTLDIHNQFTLGIESAEGEDDNLDVQIELPILAKLGSAVNLQQPQQRIIIYSLLPPKRHCHCEVTKRAQFSLSTFDQPIVFLLLVCCIF